MSSPLIDRARIRGSSRMIAQGTAAKDVTAEQIATVAADVETFCRDAHVTHKSLAKAIGYSPGVISEFIKGTYKGDNGQVAIDAEDWLVEEEQRRANQQKTEFVWTAVAKMIQAVAEYVKDYRKMGLIYGPETSGIGKTLALQAIAQRLGPRRGTYVCYDKCDASPTGVLKKTLNGLHLDESGSTLTRMHRLINFLKGRSHLLMLDQIHNLRYAKDDRPLYFLADLYDETQSAQLWCGTSDMVAYLQRQQARNADEPLAQIRRRLFPVVDLVASIEGEGGTGEPLYTVEQIREMFSRFKLRLSPAGARWLTALARVPGSGALGTCVNVMEYATMLAQRRNETVLDVPRLKEALQMGLTAQRAQTLLMETDAFFDSGKARVA